MNDGMKYSGNKISFELFGGSHQDRVGARFCGLEGKVDFDLLQKFVNKRRASVSVFSTQRIEDDKVIFDPPLSDGISGDGALYFENKNVDSSSYCQNALLPRPSHGDYVQVVKYGKDADLRGGGKCSGRMTAPITAIGGICKQRLEERGIKIKAYISQVGRVVGESYQSKDFFDSPIEVLDDFPALSERSKNAFLEEISEARGEGDSVGGAIECVIEGVPAGTGSTLFDSIEGLLSRMLFAIPGVKGVSFGSGFGLAVMKGSQANDSMYYDGDLIRTRTNHSGGINGGFANGMPITFRLAVRPTPSISKEQKTVNLESGRDQTLKIQGRHDACILPRVVPVVEAVSAIVIYDIL